MSTRHHYQVALAVVVLLRRRPTIVVLEHRLFGTPISLSCHRCHPPQTHFPRNGSSPLSNSSSAGAGKIVSTSLKGSAAHSTAMKVYRPLWLSRLMRLSSVPSAVIASPVFSNECRWQLSSSSTMVTDLSIYWVTNILRLDESAGLIIIVPGCPHSPKVDRVHSPPTPLRAVRNRHRQAGPHLHILGEKSVRGAAHLRQRPLEFVNPADLSSKRTDCCSCQVSAFPQTPFLPSSRLSYSTVSTTNANSHVLASQQ